MKKRVAVTISFSFSVRYLVRTGLLEKLRLFAEPVVCIFWNQEDLIEELKSKGFEVHVLPASQQGKQYRETRLKIDYWFRYFKLKSKQKNLEHRYLEKFRATKKIIIDRLREYYNAAKFLIPGYAKRIHRREKRLLITDTNYNAMLQLVDELNIDAVFTVTPFHNKEDIFLRAAKARNKKMITSILSFDNIVKRGWLPVNYDCYIVWNKHNAAEIRRIYKDAVELNNNSVYIEGAPQFDFYKMPEYILPKENWLQLVGLPNNDRKIILYAGGPDLLFPQEPQFLKHIDDALDNGRINGDPIVLFRCHPIDKVDRWKNIIGNSKNIYFDSSWAGASKLSYANVTDTEIAKLCSTLYYTDLHINVCSTMAVDGSAFNKPQIAPAYDEEYPNSKHPIRNLYYQEHFVPIVNTNGIAMADDRNKLIDLINEALIHPEKFITDCENVLKEIITYTDGKCTERVIKILENELSK